MAYKQKRHIVRFGSTSRGITLPKGWLDFYGLKERDPVMILGDSVLIVARPEDARQAEEVVRTLEKTTRTQVSERVGG
jgi:bifunctional DNA-binding transcriptional regulator/antitoxin component of YhaV-PrlF toxin-antitoxin module